MLSNSKIMQLLGYGRALLLLLIVSACSRDRDIPRPAAVKQIEFKEKQLSVAVGQSVELKVLHSPSELNAPEYEWFVLNPDVARVENGRLRGLSVGETVLSVTAKGLNLTARMRISVLPVLPNALQLSAEKTSLVPGEETLVTYTIDPQDVTDSDQLEIEWSSSDETICKVSGGKVLAIGAGAANVIAKIKGTAVTGTLRIQVAPVPVESVSLIVQQTTVTVGKGMRLVPRILPANATDHRLIWSCDDPQVASVIDGTVLGIKAGTTTIRVMSVDGGKGASCEVTVRPVQVQRIVLSVTDLPLVVGQEYTVGAVVLPVEASDKSLKWNSSNVSVATVSPQGQVVAKGKGTAMIWAISISNPRVQTAIQVSVGSPEDLVFTQVTASSKVSIDGYVSANLSALFENGYSSPVRLISFEVMSHSGEVVLGNYLSPVVSPSMQYRHSCTIKNIYRPYIRYMFELNGRRYERRVEIL
ncbi:hypothetical protein CPT03_12060 [Pedobacter ginsengisoli]|uniref:BIG2 domain-containing protein n=1 Tax=Pedobacter ginsengisoli TaxID=363852 RepID=A0A2D1U6B2_9SPHI|nr:Ig-like domain-containing protein [Pedobacter ginsengisoli]ATP57151.1 hypothetical protein CPT03_12060 [Pedobacter ginsengisoli]